MKRSRRILCAMASLAVTALPSFKAMADDAGKLSWVIEPYLWAPSIRSDLNLRLSPIEQSNTVSFPDILSKVSAAAELRGEAQGDDFGGFADILYLSLKDHHSRDRFSTHSSLKTSIGEAAALWSPGDVRFEGFEGFAGIRYFDASFKFRFDPTDPERRRGRVDVSKNLTDFMIGARYTFRFTPAWALTLRGDGGFGDTDTNYNASILGSYRTHHGAWLFGYRYMVTKFDDQGRNLKLKMYGPEVAYAFMF
ncbi:hypothetical protein C8J98_102135 [Luteibacter sp. OK325]|uniref:hypothetical protein n=1 Tax=Luteibacter sp. OK325 TaxID=2135670 RepID=UPI000D47768B|nr:hypothetical protein [Luteibacter sp. OK325]PTR33948.1 hypothetical protein C8J98_102135 [Luteibacter sp. OK325]